MGNYKRKIFYIVEDGRKKGNNTETVFEGLLEFLTDQDREGVILGND